MPPVEETRRTEGEREHLPSELKADVLSVKRQRPGVRLTQQQLETYLWGAQAASAPDPQIRRTAGRQHICNARFNPAVQIKRLMGRQSLLSIGFPMIVPVYEILEYDIYALLPQLFVQHGG